MSDHGGKRKFVRRGEMGHYSLEYPSGRAAEVMKEAMARRPKRPPGRPGSTPPPPPEPSQ